MGRAVVKLRGPLFTGQAPEAVAGFLTDLTQAVGDKSVEHFRFMAMATYKDPTPYYWTKVQTERVSAERVRVHDDMVVYGPWLEGIGSRNRTSRFKGYRLWRKNFQDTKAMVTRIAAAQFNNLLRRLS